MMRTTSLIVEYLVAGVMVSLALVVFIYAVIPGEIPAISGLLSPFQSDYGKAALAVIFVAVAYSLGILSELIGRLSFEWLLNIVKHDYLKKYLRELDEDEVVREELPILKTLGNVSPEDVTKKQAVKCIGPMRFFVMTKSPRLYQNIELQLHEFRLMRILFIVEAILIFAVLYNLHLDPDMSLWGVLLILILMAHITFYAIYDRFKRYCRSIGRAYRALVVDKE